MSDPMSAGITVRGSDGRSRGWMRSRSIVGPLVTIGIFKLVAAMDGPVVVFALPRIQNELGLSDAYTAASGARTKTPEHHRR